ncbi:hypothetical protein ACFL2J_06640 [Candidatus Omnitrophota bacterium]
MAIIDVDRHILLELATNFLKIEKCMPYIQKAIKLNERNQALIGHLVSNVKEVDTGKGQESKGGDGKK